MDGEGSSPSGNILTLQKSSKRPNERCDSISFSEFFATGVANERPRLPDRIILNGFAALSLRKKEEKNSKQIRIQAGMRKMSPGKDQRKRDGLNHATHGGGS